MESNKIALFQKKEIRKIIYENEWWFVINDVIAALTDSSDPAQYYKRMKSRDTELKNLTEQGGVQLVPPLMLEVESAGGKQKMYCWNTEGIFRLIQSVPSAKAEPFKRWLAKVGYERMQEIENPELATKRTRALYIAKGYSEDWIEKRMRGIAIREELTDEWKNRGAKDQIEYAILTAEISKATFGMTPGEYKEFKNQSRSKGKLKKDLRSTESKIKDNESVLVQLEKDLNYNIPKTSWTELAEAAKKKSSIEEGLLKLYSKLDELKKLNDENTDD